jgi:hypothetical protein
VRREQNARFRHNLPSPGPFSRQQSRPGSEPSLTELSALSVNAEQPHTFTSMNWLSGSGDRVAGTSSHIVGLLMHDSWTRFEPATALQDMFTLFGSSPMHRPVPALAIRYMGIEPPRYWPW